MKISAGKIEQSSFLDKTETKKTELSLQALIDSSPPLSLSTKNYWGYFLEASLTIIIFVFVFFNILWICRRRGVKRRRVR
jgi:hypothetical protein